MSFKARLARLVAVCAVAVGLTGCPENIRVTVARGSTTRHLVFRVGQERFSLAKPELSWLVIQPCRPSDKNDVVWRIGRNTFGPVDVPSVTFGVVPAGFVQTAPPRPLRPGCYVAGYAAKDGTIFVSLQPVRLKKSHLRRHVPTCM
jgi:hypothetical protein